MIFELGMSRFKILGAFPSGCYNVFNLRRKDDSRVNMPYSWLCWVIQRLYFLAMISLAWYGWNRRVWIAIFWRTFDYVNALLGTFASNYFGYCQWGGCICKKNCYGWLCEEELHGNDRRDNWNGSYWVMIWIMARRCNIFDSCTMMQWVWNSVTRGSVFQCSVSYSHVYVAC